jgi:RimJ/RimL family protein N-acetyltransferase
MDDLHVTIEPERIVTATLIMRSWSAEDAQGAFEIYGDPGTAEAIGRREPVRGLAEMRELLGHWNLQSSRSPLPQGLWAVEAADDGRLLGGATLLPFSPRDPQLVMGWHLRPEARGHGVGWADRACSGTPGVCRERRRGGLRRGAGTKHAQPRRGQTSRNDSRR